MKKIKSFSRRLSLSVLLAVGIMYSMVIAVVAASSHNMILRQSIQQVESVRDAVIADIEKQISAVEISTKVIASEASRHLDDEEFLYDLVKQFVSASPNIVGSTIAFDTCRFEGRRFFAPYAYTDIKSGKVETKQLGSDEYDYFFVDWYQIPALTGKANWSEPYFDEGGGNQFMSTYSVPIFDKDRKLLAVCTADIPLKWIADKINAIRPFEKSFTVLVSRCGNFINRLTDQSGETLFSACIETGSEGLVEIAKRIMHGEKGYGRFKFGKIHCFAVFGRLSNGWSAAVVCPNFTVLKESRKMMIILIIAGLLGLGIIYLVSRKIIDKLTTPLSQFSQSASRIALGDFNTPLPEIKSEDEIGQLRDSFEFMEKSLTEYIDNLKTATASKERYESELNIARAIQFNMVPRNFPKQDDLDLHAFMKPAREVGGDLYDFYRKGDVLSFSIGDVSGKGVPASIFMAITICALRIISGLGMKLEKVTGSINDSVAASNRDSMFVTMFNGKLDLATGEFSFCNAGHNPIIVISPDGRASFLNARANLAVGLFEGFSYQEESMVLAKGSRLVLYTDGVTEAEDKDKNQFGEERLLKWAETGFNGSAEEACKSLREAVHKFTGDIEQNDDITIMTIRT